MELNWLDIGVFLAFIGFVVVISLYKGRKEETGEDYFLAGRTLTWSLIGFSLIASNISTEHFVGMAGQGAGGVGLAIASYEWMAAITLVIVGIFFLPRFLKAGIYTIPEYLEYRYNAAARTLMAFFVMVIYIFVSIAAVIYTGALAIKTMFGLNLYLVIFLLGFIAACYTAYGGLKAVVWTDLIQGGALILGGLVVLVLGFKEVGGVKSFFQANSDRLHMFLPADHDVLPWTALVIGLWIPNFYYWGLNQFITQRTLGAKSLKQGQRGIILAAALKLFIPFIVVFPGIMALQLYGGQLPLEKADQAYPLLIRNLIPVGLRGFMFAALFGAIMSSLDSMLNSASTIFTMDLYKRHFRKDASPKSTVLVGRITTGIFVVIGCGVACFLDNPKFGGIFNYIQEFQGYISPGILAAFAFGMIFRKAPPLAGIAGLVLCAPIYGTLQFLYLLPGISKIALLNRIAVTFSEMAFLNRMAVTFAVLIFVMTIITLVKPLSKPRVMPVKEGFDVTPAPSVVWLGAAVIAATIALYIIFR